MEKRYLGEEYKYQSNCSPRATFATQTMHWGVLLFIRPSGLTSPRRTTFCAWRRLANPRNRERLILPTGSNNARSRTGATGEKGSAAIIAWRRACKGEVRDATPYSVLPGRRGPADYGASVRNTGVATLFAAVISQVDVSATTISQVRDFISAPAAPESS